MNYILRENLIAAFKQAIARATELGRGQSGQVAAWKDNVAALERGESLYIR